MSGPYDLPPALILVADFMNTSSELYVAALLAANRNGLHPGFYGKPLSNIVVSALKVRLRSDCQPANCIASEELYVSALTAEDVDEPVLGSSGIGEVPENIKQYRLAKRALIASTTAQDTESIKDRVDPANTYSDYTAQNQAGIVIREAESFDQRQSKANLAAANHMATTVLEHVEAQGITTTVFEEFEPAETRAGRLAVRLGILCSPDLPLNGYEPGPFLIRYYELMVQDASISKAQLGLYRSFGSPETLLEDEKRRYDESLAAAIRARDILESF